MTISSQLLRYKKNKRCQQTRFKNETALTYLFRTVDFSILITSQITGTGEGAITLICNLPKIGYSHLSSECIKVAKKYQARDDKSSPIIKARFLSTFSSVRSRSD